jgi:hypothetical protein
MTLKRKSQSMRPRLELLEDRVVPSIYWVKNTLDSGPNSFRQAVLDTNAHLGADEIGFKSSAFGTIKLTSELLLTGDLTISGPGASALVVSGKNTTRVFEVASGATVDIQDLTIADGRVTGTAAGAGILNQGTLTLESAVVTGNLADAAGGGIENTGTLELNRSRVAANRSAINGGGLHNAGTGVVRIDRSTIANNTTAGDGAGIRSEIGTTLSISDSSISGNSATGFGTGGIASAGKLTMRDTLIDHNTSAVGGLYLFGGGNSGDVLISHSIIRDNGPSATSGSGVGGIWSRSNGNIKIEDTTIRHNTGNLAGGIYGSGTMEIVDSTIDQNIGRDAGGINVFGELTLTGSTVNGNSGNRGGINASSATIVESTISGNTGLSVGGIYGYQLDLIRSTVSGNSAAPAGDALAVSSGVGGVLITSGLIQNSTISGNVVLAGQMHAYEGDYGDSADATGGIFAQGGFGGSAVFLENSTVAFNRVKDAPADIRATGGVAVSRPFSFTSYGYIYDFSSAFGVRNTIIARNESNRGRSDVGGEFLSAGHNLLGVLDAQASGFVGSDLTGTATNPLDPRLKPLADNGGPTKTHALEPTSPAVDAGDNLDAPSSDQRGKTRITDGTIDIGAYESKSARDGDHHYHNEDKRHLLLGLFSYLESFACSTQRDTILDSNFGPTLGSNNGSLSSSRQEPAELDLSAHDRTALDSLARESLNRFSRLLAFGSSSEVLDRIDLIFLGWLT